MKKPTPVHVVRADGSPVYNLLIDNGDDVIPFADGFGYVSRRDMTRDGCRIVPGHLAAADFQDRIRTK